MFGDTDDSEEGGLEVSGRLFGFLVAGILARICWDNCFGGGFGFVWFRECGRRDFNRAYSNYFWFGT